MIVEQIVALLALTAMEIVLGIDNIVFIAILTGRLPEKDQPNARRIGLGLALGVRLLLLFTLTWIMGAVEPIFHLTDLGIPLETLISDHELLEHVNGVSWRDIIMLVGGMFLIGKSTVEIHERVAEHDESKDEKKGYPTFMSVLIQIALLDIVFSLDSVITAVGMVEVETGSGIWAMFAGGLWVMVTAVIVAVIVMLIFAETVSRFVEKNPTIKMLALSFLILIGVMLVAEGIGTEINKGYIYFAMAFALIVEVLNLRMRKAITPTPKKEMPLHD